MKRVRWHVGERVSATAERRAMVRRARWAAAQAGFLAAIIKAIRVEWFLDCWYTDTEGRHELYGRCAWRDGKPLVWVATCDGNETDTLLHEFAHALLAPVCGLNDAPEKAIHSHNSVFWAVHGALYQHYMDNAAGPKI